MRGSPTSRGTPASVRRSGSLPLRRRAAAPGKSTRPTPATCRPPALVCDCEYLITHDQRAWQEMTDGRGPPPKGKGTLEEKPRHSPSVGREAARIDGGNRIQSSRGRPRRAAISRVGGPAAAAMPSPRNSGHNSARQANELDQDAMLKRSS